MPSFNRRGSRSFAQRSAERNVLNAMTKKRITKLSGSLRFSQRTLRLRRNFLSSFDHINHSVAWGIFLRMTENEITEKIIGCAIKVHKALGPGLLESAYEACLRHELVKSELYVERQKPVPLIYEEVKLDCGYRADLVVERKVVIEIKSVEVLNDIHLAQILTYLKLINCKIGLLMNFNVLRLIDGVRRVANNF